jgi:uncharacterized protein
MDLVNKIVRNELYQTCLKQIEELETHRVYCKHNMAHFIDVARIAYILNLEHQLSYDKTIIYAAALLHDVGKHEQYLYQIPHEIAGSRIAREILLQCGCNASDIDTIIVAIVSHRELNEKEIMNLNSIIYHADKMSRACYSCKVQESCNWDRTKKNMNITL